MSRLADDGTRLELLARALQVGLVGLLGYGVLVRNGSLIVNGILGLALTFVPDLLARRYGHEVSPTLTLWIAVAAVFHTVGYAGLYGIQSGLLSWYDQIAHAISASFVAGVGYALVEALDRRSTRIQFPSEFRFAFTLLFILAFGVAWEIVEFGVGGLASHLGATSVLVQYGMDDVVFDLVFNTIAAGLVALWGTGYFDDVAAIFSRTVASTDDR